MAVKHRWTWDSVDGRFAEMEGSYAIAAEFAAAMRRLISRLRIVPALENATLRVSMGTLMLGKGGDTWVSICWEKEGGFVVAIDKPDDRAVCTQSKRTHVAEGEAVDSALLYWQELAP